MSNKYKVNINPEIPSDENIDKSKDFEKLLKKNNGKYNPINFRKGMHKRQTIIMIVVSAIAVGLALFFST